MFLFFRLYKEISSYIEPDDINLIVKAYVLALDAHHLQKRISGEFYIEHPLEVAVILAKLRLDRESIMSGLLHDTIEDTDIEIRMIKKICGSKVLNIVQTLSKIKKIHYNSSDIAKAETFRMVILSLVHDMRYIIVKLADRLHNMRSIKYLRIEKQKRIADETLKIYAPISSRIGINKITNELNEISYRIIYPLRYKAIKNSIKKIIDNSHNFLNYNAKFLEQELKKRDCNFIKISKREKTVSSILKKMVNSKKKFFNINDIFGFRIIVKDINSCYSMLGVIHSLYKPLNNIRDYIATPKNNGYQSLHTLVLNEKGIKLEFQIRTNKMDYFSQYGVAAHWVYKEKLVNETFSKEIEKFLNLVLMK